MIYQHPLQYLCGLHEYNVFERAFTTLCYNKEWLNLNHRQCIFNPEVWKYTHMFSKNR